MTIAVVVFLLTYMGVALGEIPGLALDRTGIALLGGIAMVVSGVLNTEQAVAAVDMPTILLLFGLMVVSAQFRLGGFYTHIALAMTGTMDRPRLFLLALMGVSALLSAVLANDIVCLAFTPVLCYALLSRRLNPLPFLLGLAISSNIGSAATIIGNPQNMLIGQVGHLSFGGFTLWCLPPSLAGLGAAYGLLLLLFRDAWHGPPQTAASGGPVPGDWPAYNRHQSAKGLVVTLLLVAAFLSPLPRELSALAAAAILLCSRRMKSRSMLGLVDWQLITLFCGLFVVIQGLEATGWPERIVAALQARGVHLAQPYVLAAVSTALSNLVSNVPATMLLVRFLDPANPVPWYVLAVSSTFAGNLITIGSIANLITIEQANLCGVRIGFRDHARVGIPVTLATLAALALWMWIAQALQIGAP